MSSESTKLGYKTLRKKSTEPQWTTVTNRVSKVKMCHVIKGETVKKHTKKRLPDRSEGYRIYSPKWPLRETLTITQNTREGRTKERKWKRG